MRDQKVFLVIEVRYQITKADSNLLIREFVREDKHELAIAHNRTGRKSDSE